MLESVDRAAWRRTFFSVLQQYAWVRGAFFLAIFCGRRLIPERSRNPHKDYVAFPGDDAWSTFLDSLCRWDSSWYHRIVDHGYVTNGPYQSNTAFFPGFPYLARGLNFFLDGNGWAAGLIVSNVAFLLALVILRRLVAVSHGEGAATRATLFALVFPTTVFFSAYYSESVFFLAVVGAFYAFRQKNFWMAALFGAFASFTRSTGVFLVPAFGLALLIEARFSPRKLGWAGVRNGLILCLILVGLGAFMLIQKDHVGDPLAFVKAQAGWGRDRHEFPLLPVWREITTDHSDFYNYFEGYGALFLIIMTFVSLRYGRPEETVFLALTTFFPLSTGTTMSMLRFAATTVPIYGLLARFFATQERERAWVFFSAMMALLTALRYALWYWAG